MAETIPLMSLEDAQRWFYVDEGSPSGLRWKKPANRVRIGDVAGYRSPNKNYWKVGFMGRSYRVHRIIYLLQTGKDPHGNLVDHKEGYQNQLQLREADPFENSWNAVKQGEYAGKSCSSKYKGVSRQKNVKTNPWMAQICYKKKRIYLGSYPTEEEAAQAYNSAAIQYFGEFARLNQLEATEI